MSPSRNINLQADEVAQVVAAAGDTKTSFNTIWAKLGSSGRATFASLSLSLNDLLDILAKVRQDIGKKKNALTENMEFVSASVIKIPEPTTPDLEKTALAINQVIEGHTSSDITGLQLAISAASVVRVPSEITDFEKQKIRLTSAKLSTDLAKVTSARDTVSAVKTIVDSKLVS